MRDWSCRVNGERLFLRAPTWARRAMALAEATPAELRRDVELARGRRPRPAPGPRPRHPARAVRRRRRGRPPALAGLPAAVGLRPRRPQAGGAPGRGRWSTCSATTRRIALWCGHNEPLAHRPRARASDVRGRDVARDGARRSLPTWNKTVLDRSVQRALEKADRDPRRSIAALGRAPRHLRCSTAPTATSTSAGTTAMDELAAGAARRCPRLARFVTEFGAQAVPDTADFMEPERWPDLDWDRLAEHHALQKRVFDRHVPPADHDLRRVARRHAGVPGRRWSSRQVEDLRRLKYRPDRRLLPVLLRRRPPRRDLVGARPRPRPEGGLYGVLRDACRTVLPMFDPRDRPGPRRQRAAGRAARRGRRGRRRRPRRALDRRRRRRRRRVHRRRSMCLRARHVERSRALTRAVGEVTIRTTTSSSGSVSSPAEAEGVGFGYDGSTGAGS